MAYRANPNLLLELKKYGEINIESCFNCGNCTAICPLSTEEDTFPRRIIRYAQLGLEVPLISSKELWMCYYCGQCTQTCPRAADPGEFMATARRYAIAKYDRLGLAKWLYTSPVFHAVFLIVLAVAIGALFYTVHGPMPPDTRHLFSFIPIPFIHTVGVIVGIVVILIALLGIGTMAVDLHKSREFPTGTRLNWWHALWTTLGSEVLAQKRYREDCEAADDAPPWYAQKWLIHASMLWGFLGLLTATALDFLLDLTGIKPAGTWEPFWYPVRLLGTIAGLVLMYGVTITLIRRLRKSGASYQYSTPADWSLLILLWVAGLTGFLLEISLYLPQPHVWTAWTLIVHLAAAIELLLMLPFTKFAHAMYRTIALYIDALEPLPERETAPTGAD